MTDLRITITMREKNPADITPGPPLGMDVRAEWIINGTSVPCADPAVVLCTLAAAQESMLKSMPWNPPRTVPASLDPPGH